MASGKADSTRHAEVAAVPALDALPGHHIRRLQQIAVSSFMAETAGHAITPVQYAALATVARTPNVDQRSLARAIAFDTSTIGGVIDRLEKRALMKRSASPDDKRVNLLSLTAEGHAMLLRLQPGMLSAQQRMLAPLGDRERQTLLWLLRKVVAHDDEASDGKLVRSG